METRNIPSGSAENFNVVIEVPIGSPIKYEYDPVTKVFLVDFIYLDTVFPFNYGFVPNTLTPDGDPLDAVVLTNLPLMISSVVACRPVGLVEVLDRGDQDNKILAVPIIDRSLADLKEINDVPEGLLRQYEQFWAETAVQKNKIMEVKGFHNKARAIEEINKYLK